MKEIFEEYGPAILTVIAMVAIFGLLFISNPLSASVLEMMGNAAIPDSVARQETYDTHVDKQAFDTYASRQPPTALIEFRAVANAPIALLGYAISVQDCDGSVYDVSVGKFVEAAGESQDSEGGCVKIVSILNSAGEDCTDWYDADTDMITFQKQGIYQIEIYARDYYGVETKFICDFPVDLSPDDR